MVMQRSEALGIIGLSDGASQEDIKKAGRKALRKAHPDLGGSPEEFIKVQEALKELESPAKVEKYLAFGASVFDVVVKTKKG